MKDEQKVWIRGFEGRGDEVLKALTDLGADKCTLFDGSDSTSIYFIGHDEKIHYALCSFETTKVIMDNYKEIKLSKWKEGDVLFNRIDKSFSVYKKEKDNKSFICHIYISYDDCLFVNGWCWNKNYSLATNEEIEQFHKLLYKHKVDWDSEKKQVVDWKWKPKMEDLYFYLGNFIDVRDTEWMNTNGDKMLYEAGNCFRTREEAEAMAEKIKKLLNAES